MLGDGSQWGLSLSYEGSAVARWFGAGILLGEAFLDGHPAALVLGDNIFFRT